MSASEWCWRLVGVQHIWRLPSHPHQFKRRPFTRPLKFLSPQKNEAIISLRDLSLHLSRGWDLMGGGVPTLSPAPYGTLKHISPLWCSNSTYSMCIYAVLVRVRVSTCYKNETRIQRRPSLAREKVRILAREKVLNVFPPPLTGVKTRRLNFPCG